MRQAEHTQAIAANCSRYVDNSYIDCETRRRRTKEKGKTAEGRAGKIKYFPARGNREGRRKVPYGKKKRRKQHERDETKTKPKLKTEGDKESRTDHEQEPMQQPAWVPNAIISESIVTWSCHLLAFFCVMGVSTPHRLYIPKAVMDAVVVENITVGTIKKATIA